VLPQRTRVKICGITRPQDGVAAAAAGADAIGLVFHPDSPRCVQVEQARHIAAALPPFVTRVGLFVNADVTLVQRVLREVPLDLLQFHGDESAEYCRALARPYLKAVRMKPGLEPAAAMAAYPDAQGILFDAWEAGRYGGTGTAFDWSKLETAKNRAHLILAGGLHPGNVAEALRQVRPWAVDVSSGVESSPGIKSEALIRKFIEQVTAADRSLQ
jgi:phosphoribosylanthranilate isomerase